MEFIIGSETPVKRAHAVKMKRWYAYVGRNPASNRNSSGCPTSHFPFLDKTFATPELASPAGGDRGPRCALPTECLCQLGPKT